VQCLGNFGIYYFQRAAHLLRLESFVGHVEFAKGFYRSVRVFANSYADSGHPTKAYLRLIIVVSAR
jgi:hypothetical protein